jgi:transposase
VLVWLMTGRKVTRECRTFATTTEGLLALLAWLTECRCTQVAMEATGVYWTPVWKILSDGDFTLLVANAAHIKQVPGRKTDINDAMWIAECGRRLTAHRPASRSSLLACGLIRASFVPEEAFQELRSLMRTRKQLVREQTRHVQRIQKTLEEANIKLDSMISDILGVSGRRMIEAMIAGERNPHRLAALADRGIKASPKELYDALHGRLRQHHRRLKSRRGPQKAICAVAASILTAIYHMLNNGTPHHDLGADCFDRHSPDAKARRLVAQLARLGFEATLQPIAQAA